MSNVIQFPKQPRRRVKPYYPPDCDTAEKRASRDAAKRIAIRAATLLNW